jgi:hypothetical protein
MGVPARKLTFDMSDSAALVVPTIGATVPMAEVFADVDAR